MNRIFKKYKSQIATIFAVFLLSLAVSFIPFFSEKKEKQQTLYEMIPKGFVLLPLEISNGEDLVKLVDSHGIVDLYSFSPKTGQPSEQVAKALKILISFSEDFRFAALVPEGQVSRFFEHESPFYAVLQNSEKQGSQIHKKRIKKTIQIISETHEEQ